MYSICEIRIFLNSRPQSAILSSMPSMPACRRAHRDTQTHRTPTPIRGPANARDGRQYTGFDAPRHRRKGRLETWCGGHAPTPTARRCKDKPRIPTRRPPPKSSRRPTDRASPTQIASHFSHSSEHLQKLPHNVIMTGNSNRQTPEPKVTS